MRVGCTLGSRRQDGPGVPRTCRVRAPRSNARRWRYGCTPRSWTARVPGCARYRRSYPPRSCRAYRLCCAPWRVRQTHKLADAGRVQVGATVAHDGGPTLMPLAVATDAAGRSCRRRQRYGRDGAQIIHPCQTGAPVGSLNGDKPTPVIGCVPCWFGDGPDNADQVRREIVAETYGAQGRVHGSTVPPLTWTCPAAGHVAALTAELLAELCGSSWTRDRPVPAAVAVRAAGTGGVRRIGLACGQAQRDRCRCCRPPVGAIGGSKHIPGYLAHAATVARPHDPPGPLPVQRVRTEDVTDPQRPPIVAGTRCPAQHGGTDVLRHGQRYRR